MRKKHLKRTPTREKLENQIRKRQGDVTNREMTKLVDDLTRFVNVAHKIMTEPQARISYKEKVINHTRCGIGRHIGVHGSVDISFGSQFCSLSGIVYDQES